MEHKQSTKTKLSKEAIHALKNTRDKQVKSKKIVKK